MDTWSRDHLAVLFAHRCVARVAFLGGVAFDGDQNIFDRKTLLDAAALVYACIARHSDAMDH